MILKILGSGTIVPGSMVKNCSGYFIDNKLLLDCGAGIWRALLKNNISITGINYILLTHFHIDHVADILPVLATRWMLRDEIQNPLILCGPQGIMQWFDSLCNTTGHWVRELQVKINEISQNETKLMNYNIFALSTPHTDNSICYRIMDRYGKVFFYSGDSDFDSNLIKLAKESDIAVIEASTLQKNKMKGHLTPQLAGRVAQLAGIKCLVVSHLYPDVLKADVQSLVKEEFKGKVIIAEDDMELEF